MLSKKIAPKISQLVASFQSELAALASPAKKFWIEKYMKHTMPFRGLQQPEINDLFKKVWIKENAASFTTDEMLKVAETLMHSDFGEDKNIAVQIYQKIHAEVPYAYVKDSVKQLFLDDKIKNWAITDSLCGKFLHHWTLLSKENTILVADWRNENDLWLQRASCVAFIKRAKFGDKKPNFDGFFQILKDVTGKVVKNPERFAQLGCGWLLREMSLHDLQFVVSFIELNYDSLSREGLRYAIEKMSKRDQKRLLNFSPESSRNSASSEGEEENKEDSKSENEEDSQPEPKMRTRSRAAKK